MTEVEQIKVDLSIMSTPIAPRNARCDLMQLRVYLMLKSAKMLSRLGQFWQP